MPDRSHGRKERLILGCSFRGTSNPSWQEGKNSVLSSGSVWSRLLLTADQRHTRHKSPLLPPPTHLTVLARPRFLKVPQPSKQHHKLGTGSPKHKPIGDTPDSIMAPPHPFRPSCSALDPQGRKVPGLWLILVISSLSCPSSFPSQTFYSSCKALAQALPLSATDFS